MILLLKQKNPVSPTQKSKRGGSHEDEHFVDLCHDTGGVSRPGTPKAETLDKAAYEAGVDERMVPAERQMDMANSDSQILRNSAQEAKTRAEYYRANKQQLVNTMGAEHVKPKDV